MSFVSRFLPAAVCAAGLVLTAAAAHADNTINGTVWTNQAHYPAPLGPPTGSPNGTFTVNEINFSSMGSADYTIGSFLTSEGAMVGSPTYTAGATLNNTIFQFTGMTYLTAGTQYSVTHDDGAALYLDGGANVLGSGSGNPTSAATSYFTVAMSGNYSFELDYAEVNGAPAVLTAPFASVPPAATPEPSSMALLGTSLLGMAGAMRRRLKK